jgi:hypothetical protein
VKHYRIYSVDAQSRRVAAVSIAAKDDEHALRLVGGLPTSLRREVWDGDRFVGLIDVESTED